MIPVKIVIADDHVMVREGLKQLLELEGEIEVIGQAGDGIQCIELMQKLNPDVTLLDISMPKMGGVQVLEKLRKMNRKDKVLILTVHNEQEYLQKAIEVGVNGYVLKDSSAAVLKKAIFTVYQDGTYFEPLLEEELKKGTSESETKSREDGVLTKREVEVLKLLAEGLFNKEIASKLDISEKTVKNHVSNIFKKIGVSDRTQAAVYAIKNNFVQLF